MDNQKEVELIEKIKSEVNEIVKGEKEANEKSLNALTEKLKGLETIEILKSEVIALSTAVKALKEKAAVETELPSIRKTLKDNIEKLKAIKAGSKEMLNMKAAGTITRPGNITGANASRLPQPEYIPGMVNVPEKSPSIIQVVDYSATSSAVIIWIDEANKEGDASFIAEGALKPLHDFEIQPKVSNAKKVAVAIKVSKEMLDDIDFMESEIRSKLETRVRLKADEKVFNGDDTNPDEFDGIIQYAAAFIAGPLALAVVTPNNSDAIRACVAQIVTNSDTDRSFNPNYVFMNPGDVALMDLQKGTDGHYVLPPFSSADGRRVYGLQIIETTRIPAGYVLVGDFTKSHVREYMGLEISVGYENDDFRKNLVTMLGEMRLHHYISANEAVGFVYDQLSTIKTAITKP
jgi:HK97 family phage major capsid protein